MEISTDLYLNVNLRSNEVLITKASAMKTTNLHCIFHVISRIYTRSLSLPPSLSPSLSLSLPPSPSFSLPLSFLPSLSLSFSPSLFHLITHYYLVLVHFYHWSLPSLASFPCGCQSAVPLCLSVPFCSILAYLCWLRRMWGEGAGQPGVVGEGEASSISPRSDFQSYNRYKAVKK